MITFTAKVEKIGDYTVLQLPDSASNELPSRGQVAVTGTINGTHFEQVLEPNGKGGHWFKVKGEEGDYFTVEIAPSNTWPEPTIPHDFSQALNTAPVDVQALWKKITPMARWEWIRWVNSTAIPETRERRVEVSISKMESGKRRPCCFNLASCTDPNVSKSGKLIDERV